MIVMGIMMGIMMEQVIMMGIMMEQVIMMGIYDGTGDYDGDYYEQVEGISRSKKIKIRKKNFHSHNQTKLQFKQSTVF